MIWIKSSILLFVLSNPLLAQAALSFKQELSTDVHWLPYCLVLFTLLVILVIFSKWTKKTSRLPKQCRIIEKTLIHHKTKAYIIDYEGQRFLIADNQNAIAIQRLERVVIE